MAKHTLKILRCEHRNSVNTIFDKVAIACMPSTLLKNA